MELFVPIENSKKLSLAITQSLKNIKHNKKKLIERSKAFNIEKISNQYLNLITNEK